MSKKSELHIKYLNDPANIQEQETVSKKQLENNFSIIHDALSSSINGVIITSLNGTINYVNDAFLKMFEYNNKADVLGKLAHDFFAEQHIKHLSDVEKIINKTNHESQEFKVIQKDNNTFWVEVSSSIVTNSNGQTVGRMASFIDITKRKKTEEKNKQLTAKILRSQELERQRIAQDLHDSIGQTVHAAKLNLIAFQKNPQKYKNHFQIGLNFLDTISQELREVCNDLYPSILQDHGLESALRWHIKNYLELNNIKTNIQIDIPKDINKELEIQLYRIIKEILANIIKHSQATAITISLTRQKHAIYLLVDDNGIGFEPNLKQNDRGFGLLNIQQRVFDLGGAFQINSKKGEGTKITIILDLENERYN